MKHFWRGFALVAVLTLLTWSIGLYFSLRNQAGLPIGDHLINTIIFGRLVLVMTIFGGGISIPVLFATAFEGRDGIRFAAGGFFGLALLGLIYWLTWDVEERKIEPEEQGIIFRLRFEKR